MTVAQVQSTAPEDQVRAGIEASLAAQGGTTVVNQPGQLVMDLGGTVKTAYLAGGFRNKMKMPMRIVVTLSGGPGGTGATLDVHSRGTGSGFASGGWLGAIKQNKAEEAWLGLARESVPARVEAATPGGSAPA
jgi:hypothetical protein